MGASAGIRIASIAASPASYPDDDEPREMLSCKFIVMPGMEVTEMSQELKWCLRSKLPSDATVSK